MNEEKVKKTLQKVLEESPKRNFTESVEVAINLKDIDLRDPSKRFKADIMLPYAPHKPVKICVIGDDNMILKAKNLELGTLSAQDLERLARDPKEAKKVVNEYDYFIAIAPMMPLVGKTLGRILGPRGKMPTPIPPNADLEPLKNKYSRSVSVRLRQNPVLHARVGTRDQSVDELAENVMAVLSEVEKKVEQGERNIRSIYLKTTMGPAFKVGV